MIRCTPLALAALALTAPAAGAQVTKDEPIRVAGQPIMRFDLEHWQRIAAASSGNPRDRLRWRRESFRQQAARRLISRRWIELEAPLHGVTVTAAQVRASFRRQRDQTFESRRNFEAYLRASRQTIADILFSIRSELLANRIQRKVIADVPRRDQEAALARFVGDFNARWRAQTQCSPRYYVESNCS